MPKTKQTVEACLFSLHSVIDLAAQAHATWEATGHFVSRNRGFPLTNYLMRSSQLTMIVALFRPLDKDGFSYSFERILDYGKDEGIDLHEETCRTLIDAARPAWEKIRTLRHKAFAHSDSRFTIMELVAKMGGDASVFSTLLGQYEALLKHIYRQVGTTQFPALKVQSELVTGELGIALQAIAKVAGYPAI